MTEFQWGIVALVIACLILIYGIFEIHRQMGLWNFIKEQWYVLLAFVLIDTMVYFMFFTDNVDKYLDKLGV